MEFLCCRRHKSGWMKKRKGLTFLINRRKETKYQPTPAQTHNKKRWDYIGETLILLGLDVKLWMIHRPDLSVALDIDTLYIGRHWERERERDCWVVTQNHDRIRKWKNKPLHLIADSERHNGPAAKHNPPKRSAKFYSIRHHIEFEIFLPTTSYFFFYLSCKNSFLFPILLGSFDFISLIFFLIRSGFSKIENIVHFSWCLYKFIELRCIIARAE